jgi:hypothetical protein
VFENRVLRITHGEKRNSYRILLGNPEGKRSVGTHRRRWKNNIKMDLRYNGTVLTGLIWQRVETCGELL